MAVKSFILFTTIVFSSCGSNVKISESPEIIRAIYDTGYSGAYFSFKEDSTFEWFSGTALGASDTYQGKYLIRDNLISLNKLGFDQVIKSTELLITTKHPDPRGVAGNYLIQVDKNGKFLDSSLIFTIIVNMQDSNTQKNSLQ